MKNKRGGEQDEILIGKTANYLFKRQTLHLREKFCSRTGTVLLCWSRSL